MVVMDNVLIAKKGYIYTNGEAYGYIIRLGFNDSVDNWYEIPEEEYNRLIEKNKSEVISNV
jgi:hypothetical protein